ncbi:MAG TPA: acyl-CoA dehydrogenase family protein [Dehalococcoidia bacterium]|nr:acyl-CoA dehydrogenase family protein [Dehalococcoidia bacterium]
MPIDFNLAPDVEDVRQRVRRFMDEEVRPAEQKLRQNEADRNAYVQAIVQLRQKARSQGLWNPHLPAEWSGMGLGPVAMAFVSAEAGRTMIGPFVINAQAPDEGNMHTLLHYGTPEQKEKYLRPLADGMCRSFFAMTEPEVAGSDPTLIQTRAVLDGDEWVINGHKWFSSGAHGARFGIVIACTDENADPPQARNTAFVVEIPAEGFEIVRDVETMAGAGNHPELRFTDVRVPKESMLGGRGEGHRLGQYRLGPARLAHCMRWIGQAEVALEMLVDRALKRYSHGSYLAEKQAIQWMMADSAMELYTGKLMVLHAAYKIENKLPFRQEVAMAKVHVANTLWRIIDRAIQVHGALGITKDMPLEAMMRGARFARLADGADEVHMQTMARNVIEAYKEHGTTRSATGDLLL